MLYKATRSDPEDGRSRRESNLERRGRQAGYAPSTMSRSPGSASAMRSRRWNASISTGRTSGAAASRSSSLAQQAPELVELAVRRVVVPETGADLDRVAAAASPRNVRVAAAASLLLRPAEYPRRSRRNPSPRTRHVAVAAAPRLVSTEYPRRGRGVAAACPRNTAATCPRNTRAARVREAVRRKDAAAATWIFRADAPWRRRGCNVDSPCRRVAATPRLRRGYSVIVATPRLRRG